MANYEILLLDPTTLKIGWQSHTQFGNKRSGGVMKSFHDQPLTFYAKDSPTSKFDSFLIWWLPGDL